MIRLLPSSPSSKPSLATVAGKFLASCATTGFAGASSIAFFSTTGGAVFSLTCAISFSSSFAFFFTASDLPISLTPLSCRHAGGFFPFAREFLRLGDARWCVAVALQTTNGAVSFDDGTARTVALAAMDGDIKELKLFGLAAWHHDDALRIGTIDAGTPSDEMIVAPPMPISASIAAGILVARSTEPAPSQWW